MSNEYIVLISLCVACGFCFVVPKSELQNESEKHLELKNNIHAEEMKLPSYEKSIEFLIPKNTTGKTFSFTNYTLDIKKQNDSLKDKVFEEQVAINKSNIDERSFIFIEQRHKLPMMHHRHRLQHPFHLVNKMNYRTFIERNYNEDFIGHDDFIQSRVLNEAFAPPIKEYKMHPVDAKPIYTNKNQFISRRNFDEEAKEMKLKVQMANDMMRKQYHKTADTQSRPNIQTVKNVLSQYHPLELKHKAKDKQENVQDDRREYVELLKAPLVRPGSNDNIDIKNNDIDDGVYEDPLTPQLKTSGPYSNYGFIRPFALNSNDFQEERDDDDETRFHSKDVIDALQQTANRNDGAIKKDTLDTNPMDRKSSLRTNNAQSPQHCKNHPQKPNPLCRCAKIDMPSKTDEIKNEKVATAPESYNNMNFKSPLRLVRGPDSDDAMNKSSSSTEKSRQ